MKDPYIKIVIPAHDSESIRQYLHDYKFRFVVNDLLNLIRQELKYGHHRYDSPDNDGKTIQLDHITLTFLRNKIVEFANDNEVTLD